MTRVRLWLLIVAGLVGIAVGIGAYTFVYAQGASYLTNDPAACVNCHVMRDQYDAWLKSSHRSVAACNDCHTPHSNVLAKYWVKAQNGFWHSFYFTTGRHPDPIRITPGNRRVTEGACRDCHRAITAAIATGEPGGADPAADAHGEAAEGISCIRCHEHVGHLTR